MGLGKWLQSIGSGVNGMGAADRWERYSDEEISPEEIKRMAADRGEADPDAFYRGFRQKYNRDVDAHNRSLADQRGESFSGDYCSVCGSVLFRGDCPQCD